MYVKRNAMTCIREIVKHDNDQVNKLNKLGGPAALVKYVSETRGATRLPGVVALRHYASVDASNAKAIIDANGIFPLKDALVSDPLPFVRSAAAWTLGEIARHSVEHAAPVVDAGIHEALRTASKQIDEERRREEDEMKKHAATFVKSKSTVQPGATKKTEHEEETRGEGERRDEERLADMAAREDLRKKVFEALAKILANCKQHDTMIAIFLEEADDLKNESTQQLIKVVLDRLSTLVRERSGDCWKYSSPVRPRNRKFAQSGALQKLQELTMSDDAEIKHIVNTFFHSQIDTINAQYKDELLSLFRRKEDVLKKLDAEAANA